MAVGATVPVGQALHSVAPSTGAMVPGGHAAQARLSVEKKVPAGHGAHPPNSGGWIPLVYTYSPEGQALTQRVSAWASHGVST